MQNANKTLSERYKELEKKRSEFLERSKEFSKITLPYLIPSQEEHGTDFNVNTTGWQSFGAQAVNHLSNKIVMTLFPPSRPFFKLGFESKLKEELRESGYDEAILASHLAKLENDALTYMERITPRDMDIRTIKHLIVTGNYLHYYPSSDSKAIGVSLNNYVCRRDTTGEILEVIIRQKKAINTLSQKEQAAVLSNPENKGKKEDHEFAMLTSAKLLSSGKYEVYQECGDVRIGKKYELVKDSLPFTVLRWNYTEGENYGRGLVEDNASDFFVLQILSEAIAKGMVLMADVKYLVKAGSYTDIDHLLSSPTGEFVEGNIEDIGVLQLDKYADFTPISAVLEEYKRRLGQVFLIGSAARRDAERITAYEIRQDAHELETSLGGIYSALSEGWQKPRAVRLLALALKNSTAELKLEDFEPEIITGIEALGRMNELDKLVQLTEVLQMTQSWPEPLQARLQWDKFLGVISGEIGIEIDWLISEEEYQEQMQEAQDTEQEQMLMQEAAKAAPQLMGGQ